MAKDWTIFVKNKIHQCLISEIKFTKTGDNLEWLAERNNCSLEDLKQELKDTNNFVFAEKQEVDHKGELETRFKCYYIYSNSKGRCFLIIIREKIKIVTAFPQGRITLNKYRKKRKDLNKY